MPPTNDIFGDITAPQGVSDYDLEAGGGIGLIIFISRLIRLGTIVAGVWVMLNFILAGYEYITSGDSKGASGARDRMTMSVIGLVIIVLAYSVAGLLGFLIFGDASYILNPKICGPNDDAC